MSNFIKVLKSHFSVEKQFRMNLWIKFSGRNVNALIMEEGETFADADVGFRHVVI
jgi:hypothetical protein